MSLNTTDLQKVYVVGLGDEGLTGLNPAARSILESADIAFGAPISLRHLSGLPCEKIQLGSDLRDVVTRIESDLGQRRMVVVATGDPLFFGVARFLCDRFGEEHFEVIPHVSSMQLAFARVKQSWEDAYLANLAGREILEIIERISSAEKAGIFTTEDCPPNLFAQSLLDAEIDYFECYVCENLGSPDERVTRGDLHEISKLTFSALNVLILIRKPDRPDRVDQSESLRTFGNEDDVFLQSKPRSGLITPSEVRSVALAQMNIAATSIVWDVGAGSGSVAVEAAQLASAGNVYAIEQNADDYQLIQRNAERFGVKNLCAIHGSAPDALQGLPSPDSIFIGGTGKELAPIISVAHTQLKTGGRLVVNVAMLESLHRAWTTLKELAGEPSVWMIQVSRGQHQLGSARFESLNPSFMLAITKK